MLTFLALSCDSAFFLVLCSSVLSASLGSELLYKNSKLEFLKFFTVLHVYKWKEQNVHNFMAILYVCDQTSHKQRSLLNKYYIELRYFKYQ